MNDPFRHFFKRRAFSSLQSQSDLCMRKRKMDINKRPFAGN